MKAFVLDNIDVATLMKALDECKGNVILLTDEGDRFNLKSKLSQMTSRAVSYATQRSPAPILMMRQCSSDLTFSERLKMRLNPYLK